MQTLDFSREEFISTMAQLSACYGLTEKALPASLQDWLRKNAGQQDKVTLSMAGSEKDLDAALERLEIPERKGRKKVLLLLTYIMRNSEQVREMISTAIFDGLIEMDLARLRDFIAAVPPGESIVLKGNNRSVRLTNSSDWVRRRLIQPFMNQHVISSSLSGRQLGEAIKDPRAPLIIMGTHRLLFNKQPASEVSDEFCDLALVLLKMQRIIPESSETGREWVRMKCESKTKDSF